MIRNFIALFLLVVLYSANAYSSGDIIKSIIIKNNKRVEEATIASYLDLKKGDKFDQEKINSSLKKMFDTGLFSDLSVSRKGNNLIVNITENPIINKVVFEGNKRIKDTDLLGEISLQSRSVYTKTKIRDDTNKIRALYRRGGRFAVEVEPKIIKLDQNRVDLIFEITEGKKTTVGKIYFIGNERFDDEKLSKLINTKVSRWYSFYNNNDSYDPDKVAYDKELIRKFYISKGYADFEVTSSTAEITKDKKSFILTFTLEEGDKYKFGELTIESEIEEIDTSELYNRIVTIPGKTYNADLVDTSLNNMTSSLNDEGYAFINVSTELDKSEDDNTISLIYKIQESPKVYINKINIFGNIRTLDKVIRREFRVSEGDPFNAAKIRRSKQRIRNLGFFDNVEIKNEPTDENDQADINVEVAEKSTGELNFGAGYSTNDGALGNISLRERNLLGKGQDLRLDLQRSQSGLSINTGFTEPYFMDKDISLGFNVWNFTSRRQNNATSSVDSSGVSLRASYSLLEHLRHSIYSTLKEERVTNIKNGSSAIVRSQAGKTQAVIFGQSLMYDKRDSKYTPTEGYYIYLDQKIAALAGDLRYVRHELKTGYYKPIYKENVILKLTASAGYMTGYSGKNVRFADNFQLTGRKIRGFSNIGFGPTDQASSTGSILGGKRYYVQSTEIGFPMPIVPDELGLKGFVFHDMGAITDADAANRSQIIDENNLHASAGAGLSWTSPMGPITISYAEPYLRDSYNKIKRVQFDFGTRF